MKLTKFITAIIKLVIVLLLFNSCSNDDKWTIKKREFKKTESYNYSEYISGELDSTDQISKHDQVKVQPSEKPIVESESEKKSDSFLSRAWAGIKSFFKKLFN